MSTSLPSTQFGVLRDDTSSKIQSFPVPSSGPGEVLVQNVAVASNPKDFKHPAWEKNYSYIEGNDVAGYIVKVGEGVSDFKGGECVAAFTKMGTQDSKRCTSVNNDPHPGLYKLCAESAVFVYGVSSSVGAYVIQLVKRSGYFAVGVAGSSGDYAKSSGADVVVDYRNKSLEELEEALVKSVSGHSCIAAYDTITEGGSTLALARALAKVSMGGKSKVTHLLPLDDETKEQIPAGVEIIETYIGSAFGKDEAFCARFARQLTSYLVSSPTNTNPFKPNRVRLMPNGLASVGEGIDLLKNGKVHGEKLVYRVAETPGLQS